MVIVVAIIPCAVAVAPTAVAAMSSWTVRGDRFCVLDSLCDHLLEILMLVVIEIAFAGGLGDVGRLPLVWGGFNNLRQFVESSKRGG